MSHAQNQRYASIHVNLYQNIYFKKGNQDLNEKTDLSIKIDDADIYMNLDIY